ncbi:MAG: orotate phosphoribosyltransferase [Chlorobium sp.]|jgi:orotate phosphoribosyltransferase|uniref:orotate phosphoribosyltransferase n=1 Tax=Chlorobium sp. TaxID=1095 RepID=UPI001D7C2B80|nr:orotate phosphoribosyltransferase [Chlorobium sp.]MBN1278539.1 orotate phosphoribosyltransferase [Chlorobiaceae bacterium]MCF8215555.1 orotate phosphoribosyltransferase [Chlorobium sp.]MCF8270391.1 orotate phosphoribosyltransferase [Chlorobium sp.]MCF8286760.1 orotate phosphoribosyltransferase [Chlorobium sp.]MCF8290282.1 orotate phosphoribosyltransferase [Chlorobium sp.]
MSNPSILEVFKSTGALLEGHFRLTSGRHSNTYFQCAKVLQHPEHLSLVCGQIAGHFTESGVETVISPAIGGIVVGTEVGRQLGLKTIFAERKEGSMTIRRGFELAKGERVLVIEDVITTGGSVAEVIALIEAAGASLVGVGSVVDRSNGKVRLAENQYSVLAMEVISYRPEECPLCKAGIPLEAPGSRANYQKRDES